MSRRRRRSYRHVRRLPHKRSRPIQGRVDKATMPTVHRRHRSMSRRRRHKTNKQRRRRHSKRAKSNISSQQRRCRHHKRRSNTNQRLTVKRLTRLIRRQIQQRLKRLMRITTDQMRRQIRHKEYNNSRRRRRRHKHPVRPNMLRRRGRQKNGKTILIQLRQNPQRSTRSNRRYTRVRSRRTRSGLISNLKRRLTQVLNLKSNSTRRFGRLMNRRRRLRTRRRNRPAIQHRQRINRRIIRSNITNQTRIIRTIGLRN